MVALKWEVQNTATSELEWTFHLHSSCLVFGFKYSGLFNPTLLWMLVILSFFFLASPLGMQWDLSSLTRDQSKPVPLALGVQSLDHWTTMGAPAVLSITLRSGHLDTPWMDAFIGVCPASSIGSCSPWGHGGHCCWLWDVLFWGPYISSIQAS